MAQPSCMSFRVFFGSWRGGSMDNNCTIPKYGRPVTDSLLRRTVFRTSRTIDSMDPRLSVPSLTYIRHKLMTRDNIKARRTCAKTIQFHKFPGWRRKSLPKSVPPRLRRPFGADIGSGGPGGCGIGSRTSNSEGSRYGDRASCA